jgi:hypothetical protein
MATVYKLEIKRGMDETRIVNDCEGMERLFRTVQKGRCCATIVVHGRCSHLQPAVILFEINILHGRMIKILHHSTFGKSETVKRIKRLFKDR